MTLRSRILGVLLLLMTLAGASARTQPGQMPRQQERSTMVSYYNPAELPASPAYSHAAVVEGGRLVIVSGQQALDAQGRLVGPGDFTRQAAKVFENVKSALAAAGASVSDVIAIDTHFVDRANLPAYRDARRAFFEGRSGPAPASTTVQVPGLVAEGALIEVGVTAIVPPAQVAIRAEEWLDVVAILRARPGKADELDRLLRSNAERTRLEPGCVAYVLHRGVDDPDMFALYETWKDRAALTTHFETPHMKALAARREELVERRELLPLRRVQ